MMRESEIGRVLVASLHQGIADVLPLRLNFYENWLSAEGMRAGTIGMSSVLAVLSFLRQEGDAYERVTARAGECAADWTVENLSGFRRSVVGAMPTWVRLRLVLGIARSLVRDTCRTSRSTSRVKKATARLEVHASIFCAVREPVGHALCGFYASAVTQLMMRFQLDVRTVVVDCLGRGGRMCQFTVSVLDRGAVDRSTPRAA